MSIIANKNFILPPFEYISQKYDNKYICYETDDDGNGHFFSIKPIKLAAFNSKINIFIEQFIKNSRTSTLELVTENMSTTFMWNDMECEIILPMDVLIVTENNIVTYIHPTIGIVSTNTEETLPWRLCIIEVDFSNVIDIINTL